MEIWRTLFRISALFIFLKSLNNFFLLMSSKVFEFFPQTNDFRVSPSCHKNVLLFAFNPKKTCPSPFSQISCRQKKKSQSHKKSWSNVTSRPSTWMLAVIWLIFFGNYILFEKLFKYNNIWKEYPKKSFKLCNHNYTKPHNGYYAIFYLGENARSRRDHILDDFSDLNLQDLFWLSHFLELKNWNER